MISLLNLSVLSLIYLSLLHFLYLSLFPLLFHCVRVPIHLNYTRLIHYHLLLFHMDQILAKASNQAVTFAIRSGISLASGYAIKTITKFLDKLPESEKHRIEKARNKLQTKINIATISMDLIKLAAARGNTTLEATVTYIDELNEEIDSFDEMINVVITQLDGYNQKDSVKKVEFLLKEMLELINEAIPIINLSLITAGVNMNGAMSEKVSPGRLLQASEYLNRDNDKMRTRLETSEGSKSPKKDESEKQVGPTFDLVMYSIFFNPSRMKYINDELACISWKETFARALVRIVRDEESDDHGFHYTFKVAEDFNDGRYHDEEEPPKLLSYSTKLIERMFFSASGKLLKLEGRNSPVLIVKLVDTDKEEWIAFGELNQGEFDDDDEDGGDDDDEFEDATEGLKNPQPPRNTSLSLMEYLVRLCKLQQIEQKSLLNIQDEVLAQYLTDDVPSQSDVVPKSAKQRLREHTKNLNIDSLIEMSSNIKRLEDLDLKS